MTTTNVDLRCPVTPRRLFGRLKGQTTLVDGNLLEFACDDCRKAQRALGNDVVLVLHRYNLLGQHVETEVKRGA